MRSLDHAWLRMGLWVRIVSLAWMGSAVVYGEGSSMPGGGVGYNAVLGKLLNDIPAFAASVETTMTNSVEKTRLVIPMKMAKREDRLRIEVDFGKMQGGGLAVQGLGALQKVGMARMTSIVSPADRTMFVLFPDLKFATRVALSDADLPSPGSKVSKKALGKESLDGQPCVRQQVVLTSSDGGKTEATTWEAAALDRFPVRIAFRSEGSTIVMTFSGVRLSSPDDDSFRVPSDYKTFDSMPALMQEATTRAFNPGN